MTLTSLNSSAQDETSAYGSMYHSGHEAKSATVRLDTTLPSSTTTSIYEILRLIERTAASPIGHIAHASTETTGEAIMEIRRRSGLTWDEISALFDVSRRSVHHWANGKPVSASHDRMIRRMLAAIRYLDRGSQSDTRAMLLDVDEATGTSTFDLLVSGRFDEAENRIEGVGIRESRRIPLSRTDWKARQPQEPLLLLEAEQDRFDIQGKARTVTPKRGPKTAG
ncbi:MAG: hypothetical protein F4Z15_07810 [Gammaproteobacteria bacterium]|nr:hypothetical protein [Gammaproteobacteria bacterium]MYJ52925.1 hypothetical protein [Gammaproteobacteria bacterium]